MKKLFVSISLLLFSLGSTAQESADFKQVRDITEYYLSSLNYYVSGSGTSESIVKLFATSYSNDRTPIMDFNGKSIINESFEGMLVHCRQTIKHVDWDRNKIVPFYSNNSTLKTKVEVTYTYLENAQDKSSIKTMTVERVFEFAKREGELKIVSIVNASFIPQETIEKHLSVSKQKVDFGACKAGTTQEAKVVIEFDKFSAGDKFTVNFAESEDYKVYINGREIKYIHEFTITEHQEEISIYFTPKKTNDYTRSIIINRGDKTKIITMNGLLELAPIVDNKDFNRHLSISKDVVDFGKCTDPKSTLVTIYFAQFEQGDLFTIDFFDSPNFSILVRGTRITKRTDFRITSPKEEISILFNPSEIANYSNQIKVQRGSRTEVIIIKGQSVPVKTKPHIKIAFNFIHLYDLQENKFGFTRSLSNSQGPADIDLQGMNGSYTKFDIAYGGHLEIPAGKKGGITLGYMSGTMTSQFENQYAETTVQSGSIGFRRYMTNYNPSKGLKVRPYLELGGGLTSYSSNRHFVLDEGLFSQTEGVSFFSSASLGLEFSLSPTFKIATSSNFVLHLSDAIDGYDNLGNDLILNNTLGLVIRL